MKKRVWMVLIVLSMLTAACGTAIVEDSGVPHADMMVEREVAVSYEIDYDVKGYQQVQDFGLELFKENLDVTNPVVSPASAYIALTMAAEGADNNTYQQFIDVLGQEMQLLSDSMMNLLPYESEKLILALANSAWIDDDFTASDEWLGKLKSLYDAKVYQTDLAGKDTVSAMNGWISENTRGLIKEMIEDPFDEYARLVLFNALYFNGKWQNPFEVHQTSDNNFMLANKAEILVPMMHQYREYYNYFKGDDFSGVIMPYRDGNMAMVAILPEERKAVRELATDLSFEEISRALDSAESTYINLQLPKFEVSFDQFLNEDLQKMGITDAFDGVLADFTKMGTTASGEPIYISLVRQKAVVKVDEEGTEAAAVTEVAMMETCALMVEEPIDMFFNRPFLYMIMDMESQIPLFTGIVDNPTVEGGETYVVGDEMEWPPKSM